MVRRPRRFWPLYVLWIALCAILFFATAGLEDPSRPEGRILSIEAGQRAMTILRARDPRRFAEWEVVHVGRARAGEGGAQDRWLVLADRVPHTGLREALVVELASEDGRLIRIRPAAGPGLRIQD